MSPHPKYKPTLSKLQRLHPSAEVLAQVARMMRDNKQELEGIANILRTDASLSSDIIRMSNSSYYGFGDSIANLDQALQRIGIKEAQKLVNLSLAKSLYNKPLRHYQLSSVHYWTRGVSCALLMEQIAKHCGLSSADAYTAGTLHLIGKVVIEHLLTASANDAKLEKGMNEIEWELEQSGVHYAQAGRDLATLWRMPESITSIIGEHLEPDESSPQLAHALKLSTDLIDLCGIDLKAPPSELPASAAPFDLDIQTTEGFLQSAADNLSQLREALGMKA